MIRRPLLLIAAVAITAAALPAGAQAAESKKVDAPAFVLHPRDVPSALGKAKTGKGSYTVTEPGQGSENFQLCVPATGQPELTVPGALGWQVSVQLAGKGQRELSEWLSTFAGDGAGTANFAWLKNDAAQCNGTSTTPISDDSSHPVNGQYVNTNSTGTTADGAVWISVDTKVKSKNPKINGAVSTTYTVWRNTGSSIMQMQLHLDGKATTTAKQRAAVNNVSQKLFSIVLTPPTQ